MEEPLGILTLPSVSRLHAPCLLVLLQPAETFAETRSLDLNMKFQSAESWVLQTTTTLLIMNREIAYNVH
jgi:hypothetical protein